MPELLAACPSFAHPWHDHVADWPDSERGVYVDLGRFASHLVGRLDRQETAEFRAVFATVVAHLRTGDDGVRYALKVGFLESLGNVASNRQGWPFAARFREWFGPLTTVAWDDLHREWGTSDMDVSPAR
jgi:hypothetical protein